MFAIQIAKSRNGALAYLREHLVQGDYFEEQGKQLLTWQGSGSVRLGLTGIVKKEQYANLLDGLAPDSRRGSRLSLTARQKKDRRCAFQGVLSAPKSVSVAALVFGDIRLVAAHEEAVRATIRVLESECASARVRKDGMMDDRPTGNLIVAMVTHDSSRPVVKDGKDWIDPQLHSHLAIPNLTYDATEGIWKAIQPKDLFLKQSIIREVYWHELAKRCQACGYELEHHGYGFSLKGFEQFSQRFSKRSVQLEEFRIANGLARNAAGKALAAAESRNVKSTKTREDLRAEWKSQISTAEGEATPLPSPSTAVIKQRSLQEANNLAVNHLAERMTVFSRLELLVESIKNVRGSGVDFFGIRRSIEASKELFQANGSYATREGLKIEKDLIDLVVKGKNSKTAFNPFPAINPILGLDQVTAIREILGSKDFLIYLKGDAGTGKSTVTESLLSNIDSPALLLAPTVKARDGLKEMGNSATSDRVRNLFGKTATVAAALTNKSMWNQARNGLLLIDEAGLLGIRDMAALVKKAAEVNARVLLIGDTKQHNSVPAGDALRILEKYAHLRPSRLTEIRRQKDLVYREIVGNLAKGDSMAAARSIEKQKWLSEISDDQKRAAAVAACFLEHQQKGSSVRVVAPTWEEIDRINSAVRNRKQSDGTLSRESVDFKVIDDLKFTVAERRNWMKYKGGEQITLISEVEGCGKRGESFKVISSTTKGLMVEGSGSKPLLLPFAHAKQWSVGMVRTLTVAAGDDLHFRMNHHSSKLRNGEVDRVVSVSTEMITLASGRFFSPKAFRQFGHGYAITSYAAQGQTVDRVIVSAPVSSPAAISAQGWYVMLSRGREGLSVFTDNWAHLKTLVINPQRRKASVELIDEKKLPSSRLRYKINLQRRNEMNEIKRGQNVSH